MISYKKFEIPLKNIENITFVFPILGRFSGTPYNVHIKYYNELDTKEKHININRFPLIVLFRIRKIIGKEKIIFEDIRKRYIRTPAILFIVGMVLCFIISIFILKYK